MGSEARELQHRTRKLLETSLSVATRRSYNKALDTWKLFHRLFYPTLQSKTPDSSGILYANLPQYTKSSTAHWIAWMSLKGRCKATIRSNMSAISFHYKLVDLDPFDNYMTRKLLQGQVKLENTRREKSPLTKDLVHNLINVCRFYKACRYTKIMLKALMLLLYHCCLRIGEALTTGGAKHYLDVSDVQYHKHPPSFTIRMKSFKFSRREITLTLGESTDQSNCPVLALREFLTVRRGPKFGPLFTNKNGTHVTSHQFAAHLKALLLLGELDPKLYTSHSFRIGRATDLVMGGASSTVVQQTGRWRSGAFQKYIRPSRVPLP